MRLIRKLFLIIFWILLLLSVFGLGYYFAVTAKTSLSHEKLMLVNQNIVLYDATNKPIEDSSILQQAVTIEDVPKTTRMAFVNVEDKRFYSHNGFDLRRIIKAALRNLRSRSYKEGASTISQQLIKNTHLTHEKTVNRKLKEWKLTRALERNYTKDEILEKYLNVIYFGHNCFGLRAAARFYFDKTPSELDLADSAILAGLVKSPNNYSPFKNPEKCTKRKQSVLNIMLKNGSITQEQANEANRKPLPLAPTSTKRDFGYLHFVFDELTALAETYDFTGAGRIEIYTYLQPELQSSLEELAKTHEKSDISITVLDMQTHAFKACVSTVGCIRRLPGSLLKPLLVYAPALEERFISPATPILDEKIDYAGYSPDNYDGIFHGYVSAREALSKSYNVPAVKILDSIGLQTGATYLKELGLPVENDDLSLALALGGMKNGYTLPDLISAYATLGQKGQFIGGKFISAIKLDGKSLYERTYTPKKVFSEETAYLTTDMLKTAVESGTAKKLRTLPFDIAAKTGTAGIEKGNSDAYALSYTTKDCVGVWLGNASGALIEDTGGGLPCNYLLDVNTHLCERYQEKKQTIASFQKPQNVACVSLDKISYYDTHTLLLADDHAPAEYTFQELFAKHSIPKEKSDFFSNPSIIQPQIRYIDNHVEIAFDKGSPTQYSYKISRYDYATHTTLYFGEYVPIFTDDKIEKNKRYVYTITPYFRDREGNKIVLPEINTKQDTTLQDKEILQKEWWKK